MSLGSGLQAQPFREVHTDDSTGNEKASHPADRDLTPLAVNRWKSGFTLIELLVVMAILVLALTVIPPLLGNSLGNSKVRNAAREIIAGLRYGRSIGIASQQDETLVLDVDKKTFSVAGKQKSLNIPDGTELRLVTAESEQLSDQKGAIRFFPDGSSTGGRITLHNDVSEYIVDVNWLTGKISIVQ